MIYQRIRGPARPDAVNLLWFAQAGNCFHCGRAMLFGASANHPERWSREHLFPQCMHGGGINAIVLAHRRCNSERNDRAPSEDEIERARAIYASFGRHFVLPPLRLRPSRSLGTLGELWPNSGAEA